MFPTIFDQIENFFEFLNEKKKGKNLKKTLSFLVLRNSFETFDVKSVVFVRSQRFDEVRREFDFHYFLLQV